MAELQQNDEEIQAYQMAITDLKFDDIQIGNGQRFLLCDVSTAFPRPVVPRTLRRQVFEVLHVIFLTRLCMQQNDSLPSGLFGMAFTATLVFGLCLVLLAKHQQFKSIYAPRYRISTNLPSVFRM